MPTEQRWSGETVKRLRTKRAWTQANLARRVGVSRVTIARIEIGNRRPSLALLERLAQAFQVALADLLRRR